METDVLDIKHYYLKFLKTESLSGDLASAVSSVNQAVELYFSDRKKGKILLNDTYWDVVDAVINNRVCKGNLRDLNFSLSEKFLINFGYLDERLLALSDELKTLLVSENNSTNDLNQETLTTIYSFSQWINLEYLRFIDVKSKLFLDEKQKKIYDEYYQLPIDIEDLRVKRELYHQNSRYEKELANLSAQIENNLFVFLKMEKNIESGQKMLIEEKQEYRDIRYLVSQLKQKKVTLLHDFVRTGEDIEIEILDDKIEAAIRRMIDLELAIAKVKIEIETDMKNRQDLLINRDSKDGLLHQEDFKFKKMTFSCAKKAGQEANSVLFDSRKYILKADLVASLAKIEEFDLNLFTNSISAVRGKPAFVIVPGSGEGTYDAELNVIIIPFFPESSIDETVAYGLADYRVKTDSKNLLEYSYYEVNPSLRRYGREQFRNSFINSYVKWCLKEVRGWPVFKKEERLWFEANIAPESHVFRMPVFIREKMKTSSGINELMKQAQEALKLNENDPEANLVIALLYWLKDDAAKALACFQKNVVILAPDKFAANYNFALAVEIINRKMLSKKDYILAQWNRYIRLEENGWWHINALKRIDALSKERS